ncbi:MAG: acyl--CoA ligase, partial [Pseudonocardia sp.]|nr:acyl--CoA ligase [Pseudonocardia sp.]
MLRTEYIAPVSELLAGHARVRPDRVAYIDDERAVTYSELALTTARLAGQLRLIGVEPGERVLLYLDNRVEVAESYLAVPRAGAVGVCANPGAATPEVAHVLTDSGARVVITDTAHLGTVRELVARQRDPLAIVVVGAIDGEPGPVPELGYAELLSRAPGLGPRDCLGLDDPAWMLYTSGTTGRPKGVYLTQRGCLWVVAACWAPITGLGPDDVLLSPLPLFHSYALDLCVLGVAAVGATARLLPRFSVADIEGRFAGGPEGDVTVFPGVPTMFHYLLDRLGRDGLKAPALRLCISAGAIMPASVNERFEAAFGVPLLDGYGI